jgi:hypothetical protein
MEQFLNHPAVQAGVVPFAVALVLATVLRNTRQLSLSIAAGFACAVALTMGFGFESLTSLKKLVLVGLAGAAVSVALEAATSQPRWPLRLAICAGVALAVLWVLQRLLMQRDAATAVVAGTGAVGYCLALLAAGERVSADPVRAAAMALVLGLVSGALALLGASAQLAQLGIALGAGAGAVLLLQMLTGASAPVGWTLALAALVLAGLVGLLAVFTGLLPWYCLLPLPLVACGAKLAPGAGGPVWQRAVLSVFFALAPASIALVLAWFTAGQSVA